MRVLNFTASLINEIQDRFTGFSNKYYGSVYINASQLEKQKPIKGIYGWKTRIIRYVSRRELDLQFKPLKPDPAESLRDKIRNIATKLSSYFIIAVASCCFPITLKLGMRIKSAAVTLYKYLLITIITVCLLPIALVLDGLAKAAGAIHVITNSTPKTTRAEHPSENTLVAVQGNNISATAIEVSSPTITTAHDRSRLSDGFFAESGYTNTNTISTTIGNFTRLDSV